MGQTCLSCGGTGTCLHIENGRSYPVNCPACFGTGTKQICLKCGQALDGEQCKECVARSEAMKEMFTYCFFAAFLGIFVVLDTIYIEYPPVTSCLWILKVIAAIFVIPAAIAMVLDNCNRLTRYAALVRLMMVFAAAMLVLFAAYLYLNGHLDRNPPVESEATVSDKWVYDGRYGATDILVMSIPFNGEKFEDDVRTSFETFEATKPGDVVRVLIHPGAFSLPWYSPFVR
jgi:hypothetical protein